MSAPPGPAAAGGQAALRPAAPPPAPESWLGAALSIVEIAVTIGIGYACHLYYNLIGHLASLRGVDHGPAMLTPLDRAAPYLSFFAPFYAVAYFAPAIVLFAILPCIGRNIPAYRRIIVSFLVLYGTQCAIYLLFPVSAQVLRLPDAEIGQGVFASIVRSQYRLATIWCAFPSLHVSACWFFYRLLARHRPIARRVYLFWYVGMFIGTFSIKIHFIADGVSGLILGESADRFILRRLDGTEALRLPRVPRAVRLVVLFAVLGTLAAGIPLVKHWSGYEGPLYTVTP